MKNSKAAVATTRFKTVLTVYVTTFLLTVSSWASASAPAASKAAAPSEQAAEKVILFIGDSLTAGYGVKKEEAFPERVGAMLREKGHAVKVINGGISGSVSAEADRRLKWFLKVKPDVLVLALGANDGFKGTPPAVIKKNLEKAIDLAQQNQIKVILAGQRMFTNLGNDYTKEFEKIYRDIATEKKVAFIPFLLEGVALKRELNQADMKHPNAKGHEVVAQLVTTELEKVL